MVKLGYGCLDRTTVAGTGTKRYIVTFTGTSSNNGCFGDSGGPNLFGTSLGDANWLWGVTTGSAYNPFSTWDTFADATYFKKQIEGLMHAWGGPREFGIDRPGSDYAHVPQPTDLACQSSCDGDSRCRASTCGWNSAAGIP